MSRWIRSVIVVFGLVCLGALVGMAFGGIFGRWAGQTGPDYFIKIATPPNSFMTRDPQGVATMLGAAAGTVFGGMLAVFGVLVAMFLMWLRTREGLSTSRPPEP